MSNPDTVPKPLSGPEHNQWFAEQVHVHDSALKAYLHGAFPMVRDVDDVVQESYLRVWKRHATWPITFAKAFLFTVARRLALDLIRRDQRSPFVPVDPGQCIIADDTTLDAGAQACSDQQLALLVEAVDSLPARCREVFILCQVEGLSQKQVALRLGISESTVGVQSARGLQRCEEYVRRRAPRI